MACLQDNRLFVGVCIGFHLSKLGLFGDKTGRWVIGNGVLLGNRCCHTTLAPFSSVSVYGRDFNIFYPRQPLTTFLFTEVYNGGIGHSWYNGVLSYTQGLVVVCCRFPTPIYVEAFVKSWYLKLKIKEHAFRVFWLLDGRQTKLSVVMQLCWWFKKYTSLSWGRTPNVDVPISVPCQ